MFINWLNEINYTHFPDFRYDSLVREFSQRSEHPRGQRSEHPRGQRSEHPRCQRSEHPLPGDSDSSESIGQLDPELGRVELHPDEHEHYLNALNAEFSTTRTDLRYARSPKESPLTDTLSSGYATTHVSITTPTGGMSTYSKESPTYLDTTLDSGYVTKDGIQLNDLNETIDSDLTVRSDQGASDSEQQGAARDYKQGAASDYEQQGATTDYKQGAASDYEQHPLLPTGEYPLDQGSQKYNTEIKDISNETPLLSIARDMPPHPSRDMSPHTSRDLSQQPSSWDISQHPRGEENLMTAPIVMEPMEPCRQGSGGNNTIFDCEQGCFITVEEYNRRYGAQELWYQQ